MLAINPNGFSTINDTGVILAKASIHGTKPDMQFLIQPVYDIPFHVRRMFSDDTITMVEYDNVTIYRVCNRMVYDTHGIVTFNIVPCIQLSILDGHNYCINYKDIL